MVVLVIASRVAKVCIKGYAINETRPDIGLEISATSFDTMESEVNPCNLDVTISEGMNVFSLPKTADNAHNHAGNDGSK